MFNKLNGILKLFEKLKQVCKNAYIFTKSINKCENKIANNDFQTDILI